VVVKVAGTCLLLLLPHRVYITLGGSEPSNRRVVGGAPGTLDCIKAVAARGSAGVFHRRPLPRCIQHDLEQRIGYDIGEHLLMPPLQPAPAAAAAQHLLLPAA
jgi:hypothetical protein